MLVLAEINVAITVQVILVDDGIDLFLAWVHPQHSHRLCQLLKADRSVPVDVELVEDLPQVLQLVPLQNLS